MISNSFKAIRLKEARELRGYSIADLAKELNVSRQAIYQYEKGTAKPSMSNLVRLSNFLNLSVYYFFRDRPRYSEKSSPLYFRSFRTSSKKHRLQAARYEEWMTDLIEYLGDYLTFPPTNLLSFDGDYAKLKGKHIEEIAMELRRFWNLGDYPISNVTMLLENNGIIVSQKKLDGKLDSFSCWHNSRFHLLLTSNNRSAVRCRFNAMHEVAHGILHKEVTKDELENPKSLAIIESQAHRFASAFLMPPRTFINDFISTSIDALKHMKQKWLVSMKAITMRAHDLGIITESEKINAMKRLSPYRKQEPLDNEIPVEKPNLLSRGIDKLISGGFVTKNQMIEELNIPIRDLLELTCLDETYFNSNSDATIINLNPKKSDTDTEQALKMK